MSAAARPRARDYFPATLHFSDEMNSSAFFLVLMFFHILLFFFLSAFLLLSSSLILRRQHRATATHISGRPCNSANLSQPAGNGLGATLPRLPRDRAGRGGGGDFGLTLRCLSRVKAHLLSRPHATERVCPAPPFRESERSGVRISPRRGTCDTRVPSQNSRTFSARRETAKQRRDKYTFETASPELF